MYKWKLMISTLPVPLAVIILRFLIEYGVKASGSSYAGVMDFSALSPVLTGGVFLIGLMLSGTLQDYKESEKIPAELACSLESIEETVSWVSSNRPAVNDRALKEIIADVTAEILAWLLRQRTHEQGFAALEKLNSLVREFDKLNAGLPAARLMAELHNVRKTVTRIGVISRTGFLASGYALLDTLVVSVVLLLLCASYKAEFGTVGKYVIIGFVSLIYSYLWRLVKDVDDPFEYSPDGARTGAAEVELFPLLEYQQRALARLANSIPASGAAPSPPALQTPEALLLIPEPPAGRRSRAVAIGVGITVALLLAGGGGAAWRLRYKLGLKKSAVHWTISSVPPGAELVAEDGSVLGQTPLVIDRPRQPEPLALSLRLAGHNEAHLACAGDADCTRQIVLVAAPAPAPTPVAPEPALAPAPAPAAAAPAPEAPAAAPEPPAAAAPESPAAEEPTDSAKKKTHKRGRHHK